jgi:hypothetical protein
MPTLQRLLRLLPDIATNVVQLPDRNVFQLPAVATEVLVDLDRSLLKHRVRFLRSTLENEIVAASQPGMAILGVKGQADESRFT